MNIDLCTTQRKAQWLHTRRGTINAATKITKLSPQHREHYSNTYLWDDLAKVLRLLQLHVQLLDLDHDGLGQVVGHGEILGADRAHAHASEVNQLQYNEKRPA
jgi:hypothetical protein